jgi:hypothetical protein
VGVPAGFWKGAAVGLVAATLSLCALAGAFLGTGLPPVVDGLVGAVAGAASFVLAHLALRAVRAIGRRLPAAIVLLFGASAVTLLVLRQFGFGWPESIFYPSAAVFVLAQGALAGIVSLARVGRAGKGLLAAAVAILALDAVAVWFLASDGHDPYPLPAPASSSAPPPLPLESPAERGSFPVLRFHYGSGTDVRRPEFGSGVDWTTPAVDASKLLPQWKGFDGRAREWYWGFSPKNAPLNGRVWAPDGAGPFPLVLIVHGNHRMEEFSDPGYAYLGELLASRGMIVASVDENFVNGNWSGDFHGKEMPLRAFLLLEHLRQWREWNRTPGHRMEGRVDLERIALIGHSRGGEAIAIAAAFNRLSHFPDDATVDFDYGFSIRALVAIAQTDVRYTRRMKLDNVDFLALQGSYDSDEASFFGLRQFRRTKLEAEGEAEAASDSGASAYFFKAGVYLHRGNHGQFNTVWGRTDSGPPYSWLLNLAPLVPGEVQRQVASVYISAFLEAALHDRHAYLPLFRDSRVGRHWLPDVVLVSQFSDSTETRIADFEEDIDVTTATYPGARVETGGLALFREEELLFRDDQKQGTSAVVIGWHQQSERTEPPFYGIRFATEGAPFGPASFLTFSMSASTEKARSSGASPKEPNDEGDALEAVASVDVEIEVETVSGRKAVVPLADVAPITPPLRVRFLKLARWSREELGRNWEPELQSYEIPMRRFFSGSGSDPERLRAIRFRFRGQREGVVILDDVGTRLEPPAARPPVDSSER